MMELESLKNLKKWLPIGVLTQPALDAGNELADAVQAEVDERYIPLPLDADGVPIQPGDCVCGLNGENADAQFVTFHCDGTYDIGTRGWNPNFIKHRKPRTVEDVISEYEEAASKQEVKDYFDISKELRNIGYEQFSDEPELEFYKECEGYEFYLELPYDELQIGTDWAKVKHHGYSYRYESPNGGTTFSCQSLCNRPREEIIGMIESNIERIKRELEGGAV